MEYKWIIIKLIMTFFLTTETIAEAYSELTSLELTSPGILHIFLILKGTGYNSITFEPISKIAKEAYLPAYKISGLFAPFERTPETYNFISPFQMKAWGAQAPSENLNKWVSSRVKNNILGGATTWRPIIIDDPDGTSIKFKHDYLNVISTEHLGAKKISISAIAIWANRFTEFSQKISLSQLIEIFVSEYHITKKEFSTIFRISNHIELNFDHKIHKALAIRALIGKPAKSTDSDWLSTNTLKKYEELMLPFNKDSFTKKLNGVRQMDLDKIYEVLLDSHQIILSGPPGTSKSFIANNLAKKYFDDNFTKVQFHPKYSYQDFIGGYVVRGTNVEYENGVLIDLIDNKLQDGKRHLLIIDEINRANVGQVFGETIQLLDRDNKTQIRIDGKLKEYMLPDNLYILGTMNSSDRTLGALDFAIRRRFSFIYCPPDPFLLVDFCATNFDLSITDFLRKINLKLLEILKNPELAIGHTFFMPSSKNKGGKIVWNENDFANLFNHKILPMIEEYCHGNQSQLFSILGPDLPNRLNPPEFNKAANDLINAS
jgi:5-methylcytosine-specific restriction protein B